MALDMLKEKLITKEEAVLRVSPAQLDEFAASDYRSGAEKKLEPLAKGLPAGPGAGAGQIVFTSADAVEWANKGKKVILVREETNPEDVDGMRASQAILTPAAHDQHAALVAVAGVNAVSLVVVPFISITRKRP
jgi:pyruvate,orthophosphate dikinase